MAEPGKPTDGGSIGFASKEGTSTPHVETKRKYRRHPKLDENAPEKPPSAYVLFSNKIREEVKNDNLSFTEIAKLVGDRWQKLDPTQKEPFESHAASLKEQYNIKLSAYRKTDSYKEYSQYLADFKAKHGPQVETKRPKLDPQSSGGSMSAASIDVPDMTSATSGHTRVGSVGSISTASYSGALTSPAGGPVAPVSSFQSIPGTSGRIYPNVHRSSSPPSLQPSRERRLIAQLSSHSSTSDDSSQVPPDPLSRAATLSLSTPPTGTPPLLPHVLGSARPEPTGAMEGHVWPSRVVQAGSQVGVTTSSGPGSLASGITLPSPTFSNEAWRDRPVEWSRPGPGPPPAAVAGQAPSLSLPGLLGDRMIDRIHGPGQITLPPLRSDPIPAPSQPGFASKTLTQMVHHGANDAGRRYSQSVEGGNRQRDRNENEAANTLAGLAARPNQDSVQTRDAMRY